MKKGFEFLISKKSDEKVLSFLEKEYALKIPVLLNIFLLNFDLGEDKLQIPRFLDEDKELAFLGSVCFKVNEQTVYLNQLLSIEEIFKQYKNSKEDIEWTERKLIRIGYVGQVGFGGIYIGCHDENKDEVWLFNADSNIKFIKVADSIFSFINMLYFSTDFGNINEDQYQLLFKKWNEDFWRIDDEDFA